MFLLRPFSAVMHGLRTLRRTGTRYLSRIFEAMNHFTLDKSGFRFVQHVFGSKPYGKIDSPDHPYIAEIAKFLKGLLNARTVIVYDCNVSTNCMIPLS